MNAIKKSTWTIMILGAAAGCAGDGGDAAAPAAGTGPAPTVAKPSSSAIPPAPPIPKSGPTATSDESPAVEGPKSENTKANSGDAKLSTEEIAGIKKLPEAEQAAATQQAVCPVSSEHLGSMGKPLKVTAEGRTVYLCCGGCEKEFKSDPKSFIAKLDKKP